MQVGLTSSSLATGGTHSAAVTSSTVAPTQAVRPKPPAPALETPAPPLMPHPPRRYISPSTHQLPHTSPPG
ncbi:flagellar hook-associated protein, partial [Escherichia coli]|nr:flagellar hook-associated protein [Escherichia coli]